MIAFAADAITSFSTAPLRLASWLGLVSAGFALILLGYTLWRWVQGGTVEGWPSTMAAIVMFGAVQLIVLGILGEYVGRLFLEVKARPLYLIDTVIAGRDAHSLPSEFSRLGPDTRRELWDAILSETIPPVRKKTASV